MAISQETRTELVRQQQAMLRFNIAFIGLHNGLLDTLQNLKTATASQLARHQAP